MRRDFGFCSLLVAGLLVPSLAPAAAFAHDQSFSYASVDWGKDRIEARVTVHQDDAASLLGIAAPEALMERVVLAETTERLPAILSDRLRIRGDGEALRLAFEHAEVKPEAHSVRFSYRTEPFLRPVAHLEVECDLFPGIAGHETFLTVTEGTSTPRQYVLSSAQSRAEAYANGPAGTLAAFATYLRAGIHHIVIGPDHILFIVGLVLLGGELARVLKVATAFTLAHSITLAVAAIGWFSPPGWVVEPLIALSIVYVGIENLRLRPRAGGGDWRIRIAFCFGLVHGFGFASVLREVGLPREALGWSLLSFNLGVEAGQASIVLAVTPIVAASRGFWPRVTPRAIAACSWAIVAAGAFWFAERVRLLSSQL